MSSFVNGRGQRLQTFAWGKTSSPPSAVIFFIHGFGEYCERYSEVFAQMITKHPSLVISAFDQHGHGKSEPIDDKSRAFIQHFEDLVDDANQRYQEICKQYPSVPIFIMGISLGGLVAIHLLLKLQTLKVEGSKKVAGLILGSALVDVEWTPVLKIQASLGDCLAKCFPFAKIVPAVRPEDMNSDPVKVKEFNEDPLIYHGDVKANSGNEILKGMKGAAGKLSLIDCPVLALHGSKDKTTSLSAVQRLLAVASSQDKHLEIIPDGFHEIFFEAHAPRIIQQVTDFVKSRSNASIEGVAVKV